MTQDANNNGMSKVPFLEDALDSLDKPQTKPSPLSESSMDDELVLPDVGSGEEGAFDDDAILLDNLPDENVQPGAASIEETVSDTSASMSDDLELPQDEALSEDALADDDITLPVDDALPADDLLPTDSELPVDDELSPDATLPVDDEDILDIGIDDLDERNRGETADDQDDEFDAALPNDDELDTLPQTEENQPTVNLPVDDEDVLDIELDEAPPEESEVEVSSELPGDDFDATLPDTEASPEMSLPVDDEDVLNDSLDDLDMGMVEPEQEDGDKKDDQNELPDIEGDLPAPSEEDTVELDDDNELLDDDLGLPELDGLPTPEEPELEPEAEMPAPEDETSSDDDLDLLMGDSSDDDKELVTDAGDFEFPVASDDEEADADSAPEDDDLDDGLDLLMGDDSQEDNEPEQEAEPDVDDLDLLMGTDEESQDEQSDPISNWEQDDDDLDDDEDELLGDFMPETSTDDEFAQSMESDEQGLDDGVADMLDSFAPSMANDEDVDDFLGGIENTPEPEPEKEEDFLSSITTQEEQEPPVEPEQKEEAPAAKPEVTSEEKPDDESPKKRGILSKITRVLVAAGLLGGIGMGGMYVSQNGLPTEISSLIPSATSTTQTATVNPDVAKEIKTLRKQVEALSNEVTQIKNNADSMLGEYQRLVSLQSELSDSQGAQLKMITELKSSAQKYEGEMISRLEKLALYVKSVETGGNERQALMRDSLYKELVAYIKANASNDDAGKLTELAEALRKQSVKTAQIDAALQAQRRVVSIIEDEQDYIRETVETIRDKNAGPNTNLLAPTQPKPRPKQIETPKVEPKKDEVCCVFVEETKKQTAGKVRVKQDEEQASYRLVSVIKRGARSWDIFLEPTDASGRMSVEKYTFTPTGASSVPGYGRITDVVELKGGNARIPYKVITENGILVSRKKG